MSRKSDHHRAANGEASALYAKFSEDLGLFINLRMNGQRVTSVTLMKNPPSTAYSRDHPYLTRIIEHVASGKDDMRDIPLDLHVTPFEKSVLDQLRLVSPGDIATYSDIAMLIGKPKASRAVGSVCAKNPIAIVVPCHRIVPSSGGIGNYTSDGGPSVKAKLLEREGATSKIRPARGGKNRSLDES